ncbi:MAG: hypothetical protein IJS26_00420 [Alphaproteobacteria bacterium]|nr:hypothetical protein [Alphaproteobacteria bacterium]
MKKFNENGRSMIEMLGVLAIIGVLSAGGLAGYAKAMFRHRLNSTLDQITMLTTNIRTTYGAQTDYTDMPKDAMTLNLIPTSMGEDQTSTDDATLTLMSPFKGKVTIKTGSIYGDTNEAPNSAFIISYENLSREACVALATADFGSGAGSGFIGVNVETSGEEDKIADAEVGKGLNERNEGVPYSVTKALEACETEGNENNATVAWKFY